MKKLEEKQVMLTSYLPVMVPIIKVVGNWCNLNCEYCRYFFTHQSVRTVMSEELLEKFLREYLEVFRGCVRFTWHGGEPLSVEINFFETSFCLSTEGK